MKKRFQTCAAGSAAAFLAVLSLTGCDQPAPGMKATASSGSSSVYGETPAGTSSSAPAPSPTLGAPSASAPSATAGASSVAAAPTLPTPSVEPAPAPAAAPTSVPAPDPALANAQPPPVVEVPAPVTAPAATGEKITIKPQMPAALFVGTPLPQSSPPPNLDVSGKPTLEVQVPAGTTLLSAGKPVTSSDSAPIGELSWVTDGEKKGEDNYFVDLMPGQAWIQIDLGESKEIWLLWVWHFHKQNVIFKDVIAQISDDPEFKTATTVFNNDFDNSAGFGVGPDQSYIETNNGRAMPVNGVKGRYVRLYSSGRDLDDTNQYIEVEVYGK